MTPTIQPIPVPNQKAASSDPLVSVIIPARDVAAYIGEACRSALGQTYRNLELIVVDDGSSDGTAAVVRDLAAADSRVRLIVQPPLGVAAARNAALAVASGEFFAPLDADDIWDERKIELQVAVMMARGSAMGLVYCWWVSVDPDGRVLDRSPAWTVEGRVMRELLEVNFTGNSSVPLFRRSAVTALGAYDASLHARGRQGCEDWDLAIRVAAQYEVGVVPKVLVAYRRRADGLSAACDTMWASYLAVTDALTTRHPELLPDTLKRSRGQFALYLAGVSLWARHPVQASRWVLKVRPLSLLAEVAPHIARLLGARLLGRTRVGASTVTTRRFGDEPLPEPLIPYGDIYARRWRAPRSSTQPRS